MSQPSAVAGREQLVPVAGGVVWAGDTGGDGPALVLLNSGWGDSSIWRPVIRRYRDATQRIYADQAAAARHHGAAARMASSKGAHMRHGSHEPGTSRRAFLRRAGLAGAAATALIGVTDVAGLSQAFASSRRPIRPTSRPRNCGGGSQTCRYNPGHCNGGRPCSKGWCCYTCTGACGTHTSCIETGSCLSSFTACC